jgi:hypothetical protein
MATQINITPSYASQVLNRTLKDIPDSLVEFVRQKSADKQAQQASARAERQLLMQEARHNYNVEMDKKAENADNALNNWTSHGYDWDLLAQEDASAAYASQLPTSSAAIAGYTKEMTGYGMQANPNNLLANRDVLDKRWVNALSNRFINDARTFKQSGKNSLLSDDKLNRHLQENYNARNVFNQYANVYGYTQALNHFAEVYTPTQDKTGLGDWFSSKFVSPDITDPQAGGSVSGTGEVNVGGTAKTVGGAGFLGTVAQSTRRGMNRTQDILSDVKKDWKKGSMSAKDFLAKYGMTKTQAGGNPNVKGAKFDTADDILKYARGESFKGNIFRHGKSVLPGAIGYSAGDLGMGMLTDDETAKTVGGLTVGGISQFVASKKGRDLLKKHAPKLAAKLAVSSAGYLGPQAAEPISTALGAAGTAWAMWDIYQLAKSVPEIYDAIVGG